MAFHLVFESDLSWQPPQRLRPLHYQLALLANLGLLADLPQKVPLPVLSLLVQSLLVDVILVVHPRAGGFGLLRFEVPLLLMAIVQEVVAEGLRMVSVGSPEFTCTLTSGRDEGRLGTRLGPLTHRGDRAVAISTLVELGLGQVLETLKRP